MKIDYTTLSDQEAQEIKRLLTKSLHTPPKLEDIWLMQGLVWDELGCNNKNFNWDKISKFYKHPVWLINGFFIEQHDLSMQHRHTIADWINRHAITQVLDYGGGFGTLARLIVEKRKNLFVDIYEPYPSQYVVERMKSYSNIRFVDSLGQKYDCATCIDVLEHVSDPLNLFAEIIEAVKVDGFLLIANHFYPSTKCHLPITFHLRYTFNLLARTMGLQVIGLCPGSHATIYKKITAEPFDWTKIRILEVMSKTIFPFCRIASNLKQKAKKILR